MQQEQHKNARSSIAPPSSPFPSHLFCHPDPLVQTALPPHPPTPPDVWQQGFLCISWGQLSSLHIRPGDKPLVSRFVRLRVTLGDARSSIRSEEAPQTLDREAREDSKGGRQMRRNSLIRLIFMQAAQAFEKKKQQKQTRKHPRQAAYRGIQPPTSARRRCRHADWSGCSSDFN